MPELPEVETTKNGLAPHVLNHTVLQVNVRNPNLRWPIPHAVHQVETLKALSLTRRAKYLIWTFETGSIVMHLGMSGAMCIVDVNEEYKKHDHFEVVFDNGKALRLNDPRRFGAILWQEPQQTLDILERLGPEPLSDEFTAEYLYDKLRKRKGAIKNAIMTNAVVVGVGNIYAAESLFLCRINPQQVANTLSLKQCTLLTNVVRKVLRKAIAQGGTTLKDFMQADGNPGYFAQELNVYGRSGESCSKCKSIIENVTLGQRSSFFCPTCQPLR